jgi:hypothetical protein
MNETQRKRRGHNFLPPQAILKKIPALYATDGIIEPEDKMIYLKYFSAAGDWWIAELDPDSGMAFGYAHMADCAEWGEIYLPELEELNAHHGLVIVERDCWWKPKKFGECAT